LSGGCRTDYLNTARRLAGARGGENSRRTRLRSPLPTDHQAKSNQESYAASGQSFIPPLRTALWAGSLQWSPTPESSRQVFAAARTRQSPALFRFMCGKKRQIAFPRCMNKRNKESTHKPDGKNGLDSSSGTRFSRLFSGHPIRPTVTDRVILSGNSPANWSLSTYSD